MCSATARRACRSTNRPCGRLYIARHIAGMSGLESERRRAGRRRWRDRRRSCRAPVARCAPAVPRCCAFLVVATAVRRQAWSQRYKRLDIRPSPSRRYRPLNHANMIPAPGPCARRRAGRQYREGRRRWRPRCSVARSSAYRVLDIPAARGERSTRHRRSCASRAWIRPSWNPMPADACTTSCQTHLAPIRRQCYAPCYAVLRFKINGECDR
jgi:hypothetical protein